MWTHECRAVRAAAHGLRGVSLSPSVSLSLCVCEREFQVPSRMLVVALPRPITALQTVLCTQSAVGAPSPRLHQLVPPPPPPPPPPSLPPLLRSVGPATASAASPVRALESLRLRQSQSSPPNTHRQRAQIAQRGRNLLRCRSLSLCASLCLSVSRYDLPRLCFEHARPLYPSA